MDTTVSARKARLSFGAILYLVYLAFNFVASLPYFYYGDTLDDYFIRGIVIAFLGLIPGIMFLISLLIRKPSVFITVSTAFLTIIEFVILVLRLAPVVEELFRGDTLNSDVVSTILYSVAEIIMIFVCLLITVLSVASYVDSFREKNMLISAIKIIIIISVGGSCALLCAYYFLYVRSINVFGRDLLTQTYNCVKQFGFSILLALLKSVSFILIAFWLASPYEKVTSAPASAEAEPATAESATDTAEEPFMASASTEYSSGAGATAATVTAGATDFAKNCKSYRMDTLIHVVLLLITSGIWQLIWIYRTTELVNYAEGETKRDPLACLLLSIFVPFYRIYWVYVTSQRIDKMAKAYGIPSDICTLCLVLAFFVPVVPPILMQDKLNNIIDAATAA